MIETAPEFHQPPVARVEEYIQNNFRPGEIKRLDVLEKRLVGPESMDPRTRIPVMIPCSYQERHIDQTLELYKQAHLPSDSALEIFVLVNGPHKSNPKESVAYQQVRAFQEANPDIPVVLTDMEYQPGELRIGTLRRELSAIALRRAARANIDLDKLYLLTNDADMTAMHDKYFQEIVSKMDAKPELAGMTGFCDYSEEVFTNSPFLFTMQRFSDVLEIIQRRKDKHMVFHSANAVYRASDYMQVGGHKRNRISEGQAVYKDLRRLRPETARYSRVMKVETSARRQLAAMRENVPQAHRYEHFGTSEDFSDLYDIADIAWEDLKLNHRGEAEKMKKAFKLEFEAIWYQKLFALNKMEERTGEVNMDDIIPKLKITHAQRISEVQQQMQKAGKIVGVNFSFEEDLSIRVDTIENLRRFSG